MSLANSLRLVIFRIYRITRIKLEGNGVRHHRHTANVDANSSAAEETP
jgi:hypothetical protein